MSMEGDFYKRAAKEVSESPEELKSSVEKMWGEILNEGEAGELSSRIEELLEKIVEGKGEDFVKEIHSLLLERQNETRGDNNPEKKKSISKKIVKKSKEALGI